MGEKLKKGKLLSEKPKCARCGAGAGEECPEVGTWTYCPEPLEPFGERSAFGPTSPPDASGRPSPPPTDGGFVMVPSEPTANMMAVGDGLRYSGAANYGSGDIYAAMITAAPATPPADLGAMREEVAKLVHRAQLGSAEDFTRTATEWADVILTLLQTRVAELERERDTAIDEERASAGALFLVKVERDRLRSGATLQSALKQEAEANARAAQAQTNANEFAAALAASQRECEGLREVAAFYRDEWTVPALGPRNTPWPTVRLWADKGERARKALAQSTISQGVEE